MLCACNTWLAGLWLRYAIPPGRTMDSCLMPVCLHMPLPAKLQWLEHCKTSRHPIASCHAVCSFVQVPLHLGKVSPASTDQALEEAGIDNSSYDHLTPWQAFWTVGWMGAHACVTPHALQMWTPLPCASLSMSSSFTLFLPIAAGHAGSKFDAWLTSSAAQVRSAIVPVHLVR